MQPTDTMRAHCVDPETLAAWVEGSLTASDAAAAEVHLSTCARCQAIVAAFSAGDEDTHAAAPSAVVVPFWSRRPVQWAAATLTAAASLALWTMNRPASAPAELRRGEPAQSVTAPQALPQAEPAPAAAAPPKARPVEPAPAEPFATTELMRAVAPAASAAPEVMRETPAPPPMFEVISASNQNAPIAQDALMPRAGRGGGAGRGVATTMAGRVISNPSARWRVAGLTVERSLDSGVTWEPVTLDPPFVLTAGSAPFQNVCWLVGQDGVVFRSTNGTSFERLPAPANVHLLTVTATDASRASVTAADGRIFETVNGGAIWTVRK